MNGRKIIAISLMILMTIPGLIILAPQRTTAYPATVPTAGDYIFYDNMERTGVAAWPYWGASPTYTDNYSYLQAYSGSKSMEMAPFDGNSRQIYRYFGNNTDTRNEGIILETKFYDNASLTDNTPGACVNAKMFVGNLGTSSHVYLGMKLDLYMGQRMYSYWSTDGGAPTKYTVTGTQRTTGWHDFKIMIITHKDYNLYVDDNFVGNVTLPNETAGMDYYGVNIQSVWPPIAGERFWVDDFIIYPAWQDQIWKRTNIVAVNNVHGYDAFVAAEPTVIFEGGVFRLWYDAMDSTNGYLGYATSTDGYTWTNYPGGFLVNMSTGYRPFVTKIGAAYYLYHTEESGTYGAKHFVRHVSVDGITWGPPVDTNLGCGAVEGSWDHKLLGNIDVWKEGTTWYAIYEAASNATLWTEGLATSSDGITWTKYAGNPVMPGYWTGGNPDIHKVGGTYYGIFHGLLSSWVNNVPTDVYLFQSTNLTNWTPASFFTQYTRLNGYWGESSQVADMVYYEGLGKNWLMYAGTKNFSDNQRLYTATSDYNLTEIAEGRILQWGNHMIGGIGVTNNVTAAGKYWYSGINSMKGHYTDNMTVTTSSDINVTITAVGNSTFSWTADPGTGSPNVTYAVQGMDPSKRYYLFVDGGYIQTILPDPNGTISFSVESRPGQTSFSLEDKINSVFANFYPLILAMVMVTFLVGWVGKSRK
jgi:hypothetical protein